MYRYLLFMGRNDFDAGNILLEGHLKVVGPEIETFWALKWPGKS
jgi:hypothetical protein